MGLVFLFLCRRRKQQQNSDGHRESQPARNREPFEIDPQTRTLHPMGESAHPHDYITTYPDPFDPTVLRSFPPSDEVQSSAGFMSIYGRSLTSSASSPNGQERHPPMSNLTSSSSAARYRAPEPEQDAGPVYLPDDEEDEAEARAVAESTLPPVYSSIPGTTFRPPE